MRLRKCLRWHRVSYMGKSGWELNAVSIQNSPQAPSRFKQRVITMRAFTLAFKLLGESFR